MKKSVQVHNIGKWKLLLPLVLQMAGLFVFLAAPSESLEINFKVSSALVEIVRRMTTRPRYILAKVLLFAFRSVVSFPLLCQNKQPSNFSILTLFFSLVRQKVTIFFFCTNASWFVKDYCERLLFEPCHYFWILYFLESHMDGF